MKKILMIILFHFLCVSFIYSQDYSEKKHHLLIKVSASFPTVKTFLDEDELESLQKTSLDTLTGINIGVRYQYLLLPTIVLQELSLFSNDLSLFLNALSLFLNFGLDYTLNPKQTIVDQQKKEDPDFKPADDFDEPYITYHNIPVLIGVTLDVEINESIGLFATLEGGVSFFQATYSEFAFPGPGNRVEVDSASAGFLKPCLSIGGGIKLWKQWIVYGEYFTLFDAKERLEIEQNGRVTKGPQKDNPAKAEIEYPIEQVDVLNVGIGFRF